MGPDFGPLFFDRFHFITSFYDHIHCITLYSGTDAAPDGVGMCLCADGNEPEHLLGDEELQG